MRFKLELNGVIEHYTAYDNPPRKPYFPFESNGKTYYLPLDSTGSSKFRIYGKVPIELPPEPPPGNDILFPDAPEGLTPLKVENITLVNRTGTTATVSWTHPGNTQLSGFELKFGSTNDIVENAFKGFEYTFTNIASGIVNIRIAAVGTTGKKGRASSFNIQPF